jgi:hypothetical protein
MDYRFETLELGIDDPSTLPGDQLTKLLDAMERLYTLALLILEPAYNRPLQNHFLDSESASSARLHYLVDVSDRLKLVGTFEGLSERIVLSGRSVAMRELRTCINALLADRPATSAETGGTKLLSTLRQGALLLNLGPWHRGRLLVRLHRAFTDLIAASAILRRDEIRVLAPGEILAEEERQAA